MQRKSVTSDNLKSVGYDSVSGILEIEFKNRSIYQYSGVPESIYRGLMAASSHGTYHHQHIVDHYSYKRIQ